MDTRALDKADSSISFDLLKEWIANAYGREVGCHSAPWQSWGALAEALRTAVEERAADLRRAATGPAASEADQRAASIAEETAKALDEQEVRLHIVNLYHQQPDDLVARIIDAKLNDPSSLFHMMLNQCSMDKGREAARKEALRLWPWYLHRLVSRTDQVGLAVPVDTVDLQAAALVFETRITVSRLMDEALAFPGPDNAWCNAHLLHHRGRLAALLRTRLPEVESNHLLGAVVKVGHILTGPAEGRNFLTDTTSCDLLQELNGSSASVAWYDRDLRTYIAHSGKFVMDIPLERCQITRVVYLENNADGDQDTENRNKRGPRHAASPPGKNLPGQKDDALQGIADGSVEFQVLHELVRRLARARLGRLHQELSGHATEGPHPSQPQQQTQPRLQPEPEPQPAQPQPQPRPQPRPQSQLPEPEPQPAQPQPAQPQPQPRPQSQLPSSQPQPLQPQPPQPQPSPWMQPRPQLQSQVPQSPKISRVPFEEVCDRLRSGSTVRVVVPANWEPLPQTTQGQVALSLNQQVTISQIHSDRQWVFCEFNNGRQVSCWYPSVALALWEVRIEFTPEPSWNQYERMLPLRVGDIVVVCRWLPAPWDEWADGSLWGVPTPSRGYFPQSNVAGQFLVCDA